MLPRAEIIAPRGQDAMTPRRREIDSFEFLASWRLGSLAQFPAAATSHARRAISRNVLCNVQMLRGSSPAPHKPSRTSAGSSDRWSDLRRRLRGLVGQTGLLASRAYPRRT